MEPKGAAQEGTWSPGGRWWTAPSRSATGSAAMLAAAAYWRFSLWIGEAEPWEREDAGRSLRGRRPLEVLALAACGRHPGAALENVLAIVARMGTQRRAFGARMGRASGRKRTRRMESRARRFRWYVIGRGMTRADAAERLAEAERMDGWKVADPPSLATGYRYLPAGELPSPRLSRERFPFPSGGNHVPGTKTEKSRRHAPAGAAQTENGRKSSLGRAPPPSEPRPSPPPRRPECEQCGGTGWAHVPNRMGVVPCRCRGGPRPAPTPDPDRRQGTHASPAPLGVLLREWVE